MKKLRSQSMKGFSKLSREGFLYGMGYTEEEIHRPFVGVVNSWNEHNPGHSNLREIAERVKQGIREAGGLPFEVCTSGLCDAMALLNGRYIELPSRNLIADEVEVSIEGNSFDAMVLLTGCDSTVPGMLMAAARLDIPAIMVTPGYMPNGCYAGKEVSNMDAIVAMGKRNRGEITAEEFEGLNRNAKMGCGSCSFLATGRTMCCIAEVLGLCMPGNSTVDATDKRLGKMGYEAGRRVMEMLEQGITARSFFTKESLENAIIADVAMAGSPNLFMHIPAIAYEAEVEGDWWAFWDKMSREVPLLLNVEPNGRYVFKDFNIAGGMKGFLGTLLPHMHGDVPVATGKTFREEYENSPVYNRNVIRPLDNPVSEEGGVAVMYGNIAPEGTIVKVGACPPNLRHFEGTVVAFDDVASAEKAWRNGEFKDGDAIIVKYQGPSCTVAKEPSMGNMAGIVMEIGSSSLYDKVAFITDGELSGGNKGLSMSWTSPESAHGGPLAIAQTGDRIVIDIETRSVNIDVSDAEIAKRLQEVKPVTVDERKIPPMLRVFARNITSTAQGSAWKRNF